MLGTVRMLSPYYSCNVDATRLCASFDKSCNGLNRSIVNVPRDLEGVVLPAHNGAQHVDLHVPERGLVELAGLHPRQALGGGLDICRDNRKITMLIHMIRIRCLDSRTYVVQRQKGVSGDV